MRSHPPPPPVLRLSLTAMCLGYFLLRDRAGLTFARWSVEASGLAAGAEGPRLDEAVGVVDFGLDLALLVAGALLSTRLAPAAALVVAGWVLLLLWRERARSEAVRREN